MDDVLTLLVHLGYPGYDGEAGAAYIPNEEVRDEFVRAIKSEGWQEVAWAVERSETLLK